MDASPSTVASGAPDEHDDERAPTLGDRLYQILAAYALLIGAMFLPDRHVPELVRAKRWGLPLLAVILCGVFASWAISTRLDMTPRGGPSSGGPGAREGGGPPPGAQQGPPSMQSDREIAEQAAKAKNMKVVGLYFKAVAAPLVGGFLIALALFLVSLYMRRKATFGQVFAAVALYMLPGGVLELIRGGAALASPVVTEDQLPTLVRVSGVPAELSDVFSAPIVLWSFWILIVGYAAANGTPKWKALLALLAIGALLTLIFIVVFK